MSLKSQRALERGLVAVAAGLACAAAVPLAQAQAADELPARRVSVDPETGELRTAPHDAAPAAALRAAPAARLAATAGHPLLRRLQAAPVPARMGTIGRRVDPSTLSYSVVRLQADGSLAQVCVDGEDAAAHALHAHTAEVPNDR